MAEIGAPHLGWIASLSAGGQGATLLAYVVLALVVYRWGLAIYGPGAAAGAVILSAGALAVGPVAAAPSAAIGCVALLIALVQLSHCALDPKVTSALAAGAAAGVALWLLASATIWLALVAAVVVVRALAVGEREPKGRSVRGALVAVLLALCVSLGVAQILGYAVPIPVDRGIDRIAVPSAAAWGLPVLALPLIVRPWRAHRRYVDRCLVLGAVLLPIAAWGSGGGAAYAAAVGPLALLGAAVWDYGSEGWRRSIGWGSVIAQVAIGVTRGLLIGRL